MSERTYLLVVHKGDHSLGFYDPDTGAMLDCVDVDPYPHEFAVSPDGRLAYLCQFGVALAEDEGPGGNRVAVVDVLRRTLSGWLDCGGFRRPHGIDVDDHRRVYTLSEQSSRLLCFEDGRLVADCATGGEGSHFLTMHRDGGRGYASNMVSGTVSALSPHVENAPRLFEVGDRPEGSVLSPDESRLFVTNRESAEISVIDTRSSRVLPAIRTPPGPVRICRTGSGTLLVALYHAAALAILHPDRAARQTIVELPGQPISVSFDEPTQRAFLSLLGADVCVIDVLGAKLKRRIETRADPDPTAVVRLVAS